VDPSILDDFIDITPGLRGGVYVLLRAGVPVFVGRASSSMLAKILVHRDNAGKSVPDWFPVRGIRFDQALVRYVHPDRLEATYASLVAALRPVHNAPPTQSKVAAHH
jgi:hypothetical protein